MPYVGPPNFTRVSRIQRRDWTTRYPSNWQELSLEVRTEANMTCTKCGCKSSKDNPIQSDHIIPLAKGGNNAKANLRAYCKLCNNKRKRGQTKRAKER